MRMDGNVSGGGGIAPADGNVTGGGIASMDGNVSGGGGFTAPLGGSR